jgi:hypothetical protein
MDCFHPFQVLHRLLIGSPVPSADRVLDQLRIERERFPGMAFLGRLRHLSLVVSLFPRLHPGEQLKGS